MPTWWRNAEVMPQSFPLDSETSSTSVERHFFRKCGYVLLYSHSPGLLLPSGEVDIPRRLGQAEAASQTGSWTAAVEENLSYLLLLAAFSGAAEQDTFQAASLLLENSYFLWVFLPGRLQNCQEYLFTRCWHVSRLVPLIIQSTSHTTTAAGGPPTPSGKQP